MYIHAYKSSRKTPECTARPTGGTETERTTHQSTGSQNQTPLLPERMAINSCALFILELEVCCYILLHTQRAQPDWFNLEAETLEMV